MNTNEKVVRDFWRLFDENKFDEAAELMEPTAVVRWCNTREVFKNRDNFIMANKKYPGHWNNTIEKLITKEDMIISVIKIELEDHSVSLFATSFFTLNNGKIIEIEEYFGDNGEPPKWRLDEQLSERY